MNGKRFNGLCIALLFGRERCVGCWRHVHLAADRTNIYIYIYIYIYYHNYDVFTVYCFCRHRVLSSKSKYQGPLKALSCSSTVSCNSMVLNRNQTVMPDTLESRRCLTAQELIASRKPSLFTSVLTGTQNPGITWKKSRLSAQYSVGDSHCRLVFESFVSWLKTKSRWLKTNCRVINFRDMLLQGNPYISSNW